MYLFQNKQEDIYGNLDAYYAPASDESEIFSLNSKLVVWKTFLMNISSITNISWLVSSWIFLFIILE